MFRKGGIVVDNFKAVYRILSALEKAMDVPEFDVSQIRPDALGVSRQRWGRYDAVGLSNILDREINR